MRTSVEIEIGVRGRPGLEAFVHAFEQYNVLGIILTHLGPCRLIARHAAKPKMFPGMRKFPAYAERVAQVVQLIAIKSEMFTGDLKGVYRFVRTRGLEAVLDKPGVALLDVEPVAIMRDYNIGLVKNLPEIDDEGLVVFFVARKGGIIGKGFRDDALGAVPFVGEGQHIPVSMNVNHVLLPPSPYPR